MQHYAEWLGWAARHWDAKSRQPTRVLDSRTTGASPFCFCAFRCCRAEPNDRPVLTCIPALWWRGKLRVTRSGSVVRLPALARVVCREKRSPWKIRLVGAIRLAFGARCLLHISRCARFGKPQEPLRAASTPLAPQAASTPQSRSDSSLSSNPSPQLAPRALPLEFY